MTKLYFLLFLCALTRADHPLNKHSALGAHDGGGISLSPYLKDGQTGYEASSGSAAYGASGSGNNGKDSRTSSGYGGANEQSSYSSQSGSYGSKSNLNQGNEASSYKTGPSSGYSGSSSPSSYSGSGSSPGYHDSSNDYSGSATKSAYTGSSSNGAYTQTQTYTGTTNVQGSASSERDHNGLSINDLENLAAEGNRRRLHSKYYNLPPLARKVAPKRYGSLAPKYLSQRPVYSRSGEAAGSNYASNYGSSGSNAEKSYNAEQNQKEHSYNNAGSGYDYSSNENHGNRESHQGYSGHAHQAGHSGATSGYGNNEASQQYRGANSYPAASDQSDNAGQESEGSRRFFLQNGYNPFLSSPYNNLDPFNGFNSENYLKAALGSIQ